MTLQTGLVPNGYILPPVDVQSGLWKDVSDEEREEKEVRRDRQTDRDRIIGQCKSNTNDNNNTLLRVSCVQSVLCVLFWLILVSISAVEPWPLKITAITILTRRAVTAYQRLQRSWACWLSFPERLWAVSDIRPSLEIPAASRCMQSCLGCVQPQEV